MTPVLKAMVEAMGAEFERQVDACCGTTQYGGDGEVCLREIDPEGIDLEKVARAGLEAIREPTEEMREGWFAGEDDFADHPVEFALNGARWASTIDAILTPTTGEGND